MAKCKKCGNDLRVIKSDLRVKGDKSPDTQTKVFRVLTLSCINKQCADYKKEVEIEHLIHKVSNIARNG